MFNLYPRLDLRENDMTWEEIAALYGPPPLGALVKELDHISDHYRALIEASPFLVLATCGSAGLDCSPRGDAPGFVEIQDSQTLLLPDRRGNNRIDSLRNIASDPRIAIIFLIPGSGETLRVSGTAIISADAELCQRFAVASKIPKTVLIIRVQRALFQCARAIERSSLWDTAQHRRPAVPSAGQMLSALSSRRIDADEYDRRLRHVIIHELY